MMDGERETTLELSDAQRMALELLLKGLTQEDAGSAVGMCGRTVRNWLRTPAFRTALQQARADTWTQTASMLQAHNHKAVETLYTVMTDATCRGWERVGAAKALLEQSRKAVELDDVQLRPAEVEAKLEAALSGAD
jgi:hypothetical protein